MFLIILKIFNLKNLFKTPIFNQESLIIQISKKVINKMSFQDHIKYIDLIAQFSDAYLCLIIFNKQ